MKIHILLFLVLILAASCSTTTTKTETDSVAPADSSSTDTVVSNRLSTDEISRSHLQQLKPGDTLPDLDSLKSLLTWGITPVEPNTFTLGTDTFLMQTILPSFECSGSFCYEETIKLVRKGRKDTARFRCYNGFGFFSDAGSNGDLDYIHIRELYESINEATTFEIRATPVFKTAKNKKQLADHVIRFKMPGGYFQSDTDKRGIIIKEISWPLH